MIWGHIHALQSAMQATLVGGAQSFVDTLLDTNGQKGWSVTPTAGTYAALEVRHDGSPDSKTFNLQAMITGNAKGGEVTARSLALDADVTDTADKTWTLVAERQTGSTTVNDLTVSSDGAGALLKVNKDLRLAAGTSVQLVDTASLQVLDDTTPPNLLWSVSRTDKDLVLLADKDKNTGGMVGIGGA